MPHTESPISDKQRAANRANACHSTGPRTPQGKARSSQNARKHGFTASTYNVVRLEDIHEISNLRADLKAVYQPVNSQELFAIECIALAQQSLLRAARLESGLFTTCLNESLDSNNRPKIMMNMTLAGDGDIEITRAQNRSFLLGEGFHQMARGSNVWSLFLRYQAQAERQYRRAIEEFERLKALREDLPEELPNEPISEPDPEAPQAERTPSDENPPPGNLAPEPDPSAASPEQATRAETSMALAEWDLRITPDGEPPPVEPTATPPPE